MKHLFLFAAMGFLAIASAAHAQQMMIGVRGGANFANEAWNDPGNTQSVSVKPGVIGGAEFDYALDRFLAISFDVLYDQKGAYYRSTDGIYNQDSAAWTTGYLEVPLLAKVSFGRGAINPYLFAGSSIGFLLSNVEKLHTYRSTFVPDGVGGLYPVDTTADIADSTTKIDFSIVAGAGISFRFPTGPVLFFDAAYAYGLTNIDNYYWDKIYGISMFSRDIRLAAGILFPIK